MINMHNYEINYSPFKPEFLIVYDRDLIEIMEDIKISIENIYHKTVNVYEKNFFFKLAHNFDNFIYVTKTNNFKNYLQETIKFLRSIKHKSSKEVEKISKLTKVFIETCKKLEIYISRILSVMTSNNIKNFKIAAKRVNYGMNKMVAYIAAEAITEFINVSNYKIDRQETQKYFIL